MKAKVIYLALLLQLLFLTSCGDKPSAASSAASFINSASASSLSEPETKAYVFTCNFSR